MQKQDRLLEKLLEVVLAWGNMQDHFTPPMRQYALRNARGKGLLAAHEALRRTRPLLKIVAVPYFTRTAADMLEFYRELFEEKYPKSIVSWPEVLNGQNVTRSASAPAIESISIKFELVDLGANYIPNLPVTLTAMPRTKPFDHAAVFAALLQYPDVAKKLGLSGIPHILVGGYEMYVKDLGFSKSSCAPLIRGGIQGPILDVAPRDTPVFNVSVPERVSLDSL